MSSEGAEGFVPGSVGNFETVENIEISPQVGTAMSLAPSATMDMDMAASQTRAAALELMEEVDRLMRRHQAEVTHCFDDWLRSREEQQQQQHQQQVLQQHHQQGQNGQQLQPPQVVAPTPQQSPACVWTEVSEPRRVTKEATQSSWIGKSFSAVPTCLGVSGKDQMAKEVAAGSKPKKRRARQRHDEIVTRSHKTTESLASMSRLQAVTRSRYYEWFSGSLIFVNAIFIGWQTQHAAVNSEADAMAGRQFSGQGAGFMAGQVIFAVLFTAELGLRWIAEGLFQFFTDSDVWWNVMDAGVVLLSLVDLAIEAAAADPALAKTFLGNVSTMRVIRVVRVVRVARVIRIMKFFRELRMMVFSILGSLKSLLWVLVVLAMTFYIFGITFTAAVTSELTTPTQWVESEDLRNAFGTLDRSILSLFMAMSGGDDWAVFYNALDRLPAHYRLFFLVYITFAVFGVVNIVTGVFVESAMQNSKCDRDVVIQEEMEAKKAYLRSMREVFDEMDLNSTGCISLDEFEKNLDDERVIAYFHALKLDVSDAHTLFRLIDFDGSNEVSIDEFLTGCYRLQGESRSLDMKIMQCEVRYMQESFVDIVDMLKEIRASCQAKPSVLGPRQSR